MWLEGDIAFHPGYGATTPDKETSPLVDTLAKLNRAGFWTQSSQPGEVDGDWSQRAYVAGFAEVDVADRIMSGLSSIELVVVAIPSGSGRTRAQIVVSREGTREHTWVGFGGGSDDLRFQYGPGLEPAAVEALISAWELPVFDPVWGRKDRLW